MYETLLRLYLAGRVNDAGVRAAVKRGWITPAEAEEICKQKRG